MNPLPHLPAGPTDLTSLSLLQRVRSAEEGAWEQLVTLYSPLVWSWCRRSGLQSSDIEDVFQEIFSSVFVALPSFRRDQGGQTFRGWLRIISRNAICDHFRRRANGIAAVGGSSAQRRLADLPASHATDSSALIDMDVDEQSERTLLLQRALEMLRERFSEHVWQAFERTTMGNATAQDVADDLGMTAAAVRQAKLRVLKRLRMEFSELIGISDSVDQEE